MKDKLELLEMFVIAIVQYVGLGVECALQTFTTTLCYGVKISFSAC